MAKLTSTSKNLICTISLLALASCPALVLPPAVGPDGTAGASEPQGNSPASEAGPAGIGPTTPAPPLVNARTIPTIDPGRTRIFTDADGGTTVCSELLDNPISLPPPDSSESRCLLPRYTTIFNDNNPSTNLVKAGVQATATSLIPGHARSAVYNDFTVGGSGGVPVDAQIAVTFDFVGKIYGVSVYRDALILSLWVRDLTNGQPVGAQCLREQSRDGDQGITDVSGTAEIVPEDDVSNGLGVKLLRGHTYRVYFQLDAENFGAGVAHGAAQWSKLVVSIDAIDNCEPVAQHRKNQGCDGIDNDCNGMIDDCGEDVFGPDVFVDPSIRGKCYPSAAAALSAMAQATNARDDCGHVTIIPILSGPACDVVGTVSATDDCGNTTTVSGIALCIDGEAPVVTCSTSITSLWPANNSFANVGFSYSAVDNCGGELQIEVKVTSDESTTLSPGNGQAASFPDAVILKTIDGAVHGILLRSERDGGGDGRVYVIHVRATDRCGNVGRASCAVSVPPNGSSQAVDSGQYFDATGMN